MNYTPPLGGWRRHLHGLLVACITVLALSGASCKSSQKVSSEGLYEQRTTRTDTVHEMRILTKEAVKADTVMLTLTPQSLRSLPAGAVYTQRSGRASVQVQKADTALVITATCDSLLRQIELYERQARQYQQEAYKWKHLYTLQKRTDSPVPTLARQALIVLGLAAVGFGLYRGIFTNQK